jgi:hypothetical protein
VCAQIIVAGEKSAPDDSVSQIAERIKGTIFLGTPFGGSSLASLGDAIRRVFNVVKETDKGTLKTLKCDAQELKGLRNMFPDIIRKRLATERKIGVVFFFETLATYRVLVRLDKSKELSGSMLT